MRVDWSNLSGTQSYTNHTTCTVHECTLCISYYYHYMQITVQHDVYVVLMYMMYECTVCGVRIHYFFFMFFQFLNFVWLTSKSNKKGVIFGQYSSCVQVYTYIHVCTYMNVTSMHYSFVFLCPPDLCTSTCRSATTFLPLLLPLSLPFQLCTAS